MGVILLAAVPVLLTEYGLRTRDSIMKGLSSSWRVQRAVFRLALWFFLALITGIRPRSLVLLGLGFILSELGAVVLRRRVRIDIENGRPHGLPHTHLIPFAAGVLLSAAAFLLETSSSALLSQGILQFGSLAPILIFSVIALWGWGTIVTVSVVDLVRPGQVRDDPERAGAGEVIGVLERLVTFMLIATGAFTAVGFVVAAKAAARFPLFKEKAFAEYFLIGTLTSVGLALLLGLLVLMGS